MPALTFVDARETVIRTVRHGRTHPAIEGIPLSRPAGRVLGADAAADRDSPALARSVRDGYAVRAADVPRSIAKSIGEVRAGERFAGDLAPGQAVEIMTGAPIPHGADAVVMVEHTTPRRRARASSTAPPSPGSSSIREAAKRRAGEIVLRAGQAPGLHRRRAAGGRRPRPRAGLPRSPVVAIVATGDEIVEVARDAREFQIRNSNAWSLAAQVARAGGMPASAAGRPRHRGTHARSRSSRASRPICCCSPAASRRASTTWWSRCWPDSARNSFSTAC